MAMDFNRPFVSRPLKKGDSHLAMLGIQEDF